MSTSLRYLEFVSGDCVKIEAQTEQPTGTYEEGRASERWRREAVAAIWARTLLMVKT